MKVLGSVVLVLAICVSAILPTNAAADKILQNVRGDVSYQTGSNAPVPVGANATVSIADNDYAITGGNLSQAAIVLPDSTKILVGQNTKVQLAAFDQQPNLTTAKFVILQGKTRFLVQHPGGAKANYTFQTSSAQVAVGGTEGDIWMDPTTLQVNVYDVTDPSVPVEVTMNDGKVYKLSAGQALTVSLGAAAEVAEVTEQSIVTFNEFGPPEAAEKNGHEQGVAAPGIPEGAIIGAGAAAAAGILLATSGAHTQPSSPAPPPLTPTPSPTPAQIPICSGMGAQPFVPAISPGIGIGVSVHGHVVQPPQPHPQATTSCPPTPMAAPPVMSRPPKPPKRAR
jgi:hypothetical protein